MRDKRAQDPDSVRPIPIYKQERFDRLPASVNGGYGHVADKRRKSGDHPRSCACDSLKGQEKKASRSFSDGLFSKSLLTEMTKMPSYLECFNAETSANDASTLSLEHRHPSV